MTPQLWIGFGFLTALVIFLIVSFFFAPKLTDDQRRTMKFLTALCAGVAGGFLSGASGTGLTPEDHVILLPRFQRLARDAESVAALSQDFVGELERA
jgi:uncharacterized membrane protein YfcA